MYVFANPEEVPVPFQISPQLLRSVPRRFESERHFLETLEQVIEYLEAGADPMLYWNHEDADFALHMLATALSNIGEPVPIETDHRFVDGEEMIGTLRQKRSSQQRYLLQKMEILQIVVGKLR